MTYLQKSVRLRYYCTTMHFEIAQWSRFNVSHMCAKLVVSVPKLLKKASLHESSDSLSENANLRPTAGQKLAVGITTSDQTSYQFAFLSKMMKHALQMMEQLFTGLTMSTGHALPYTLKKRHRNIAELPNCQILQ